MPATPPHFEAADQVAARLAAAGLRVDATPECVKDWGRSRVHRAQTSAGTLWVKQAYGLPPGEHVVAARMARRHPGLVPEVVAAWDGGYAMAPLPGVELTPEHDAATWTRVAAVLGQLCAAEREHAPRWLADGVRDRRPAAWGPAVTALLRSAVVARLPAERRRQLAASESEWIGRYEQAFAAPPTLIHQDSGCCNIHVAGEQVVVFDWSDVVVGHPAFSCDRFLDQTPPAAREPVLEAFCQAAGIARDECAAMRRSNVLHEVLRYHDELLHIPENDALHTSLVRSVHSQLVVLLDHEAR